ncbi:large ribosomal subunit protein bL35 [Shigella flexneri]
MRSLVIKMPKIKTVTRAAKRFKKTGRWFKHKHANLRHIRDQKRPNVNVTCVRKPWFPKGDLGLVIARLLYA